MFKNNDKLTISLINAKDIEDNILPFNLTLPFSEEIDFNVLKDVVSIDAFENQQIDVNMEYPARKVFSIYIGNCSNISNLYDPFNDLAKYIKAGVNISSITSPVCYVRKDDTQIIFASLEPGDILVNNLEELQIIIEKLNNSVKKITTEIANVKTLSLVPLRRHRKKNKNAN